jgi:formate dehydrogenase (NADP+) beta subunit
VPAWLDLAQAGKFRGLANDPARQSVSHGRVCYHPAKQAATAPNAVERFLGDIANEQGWTPDKPAASTGKRILVVGGGPSGFSAAYHLTRMGHDVEVREARPLPGGILHFGIPAYRLPRDIIMAEIRRIKSIGVKITLRSTHRSTIPRAPT